MNVQRNTFIDIDAIIKNGGGTFECLPGGLVPFTPTDGFFVSLGQEHETKVPATILDPHILWTVANRVHQVHRDALVGVWLSDDGVWFIEPSEHIEGKCEAMEVAREREQSAIWDVLLGEAVHVFSKHGQELIDSLVSDD
jgi:hypothetical protein